MEQPFKRRRVMSSADTITNAINTAGVSEATWYSSERIIENDPEREQIPQAHTQSDASSAIGSLINRPKVSPEALISGYFRRSVLQPRDPPQQESTDAPNTPIVSVVRVIVHSRDATLTKLYVPATASAFSLPGFGSSTFNGNPANPSRLSPMLPVTPLVASQSIILPPYSHAPPSTQVSAPSSLSLPLSQSSASWQLAKPQDYSGSSVASSTASANPTSVSLNLQGLSSQRVFSPSPSSPLASSVAGSWASSSDSTSIFPSSAATPLQSSTISTLPLGISQPTPDSRTRSMPSVGNFSTSALSSSQLSITSTRPTTLRTGTSTHNVTRTSTTSTKSHSLSRTSSRRTKTSSSAPTNSLSASSRSTLTPSSFIILTSSLSSQTLLSSTTITSGVISVTGVGSGGGSSNSNGNPATSSTAVGTNNGSGGGAAPFTPIVVGGVVGGLAGLSILLILALFLIRRRWSRLPSRRPTSPPIPPALPPSSADQGTTITERSSVVPLAGAGFFKRLRPDSGQTAATSDTGPSERGFQNFGGRKLESVLSSRGDGYGEPGHPSAAGALGAGAPHNSSFGYSPGPSEQGTLSGSSFYWDSQGFYGGTEIDRGSTQSSMLVGPGSPQAPSPTVIPPVGAGPPPESVQSSSRGNSEVAVMRPGPARTPVTNQPSFTPLRNAPRPPRSTPPPRALPIAASPVNRPTDELGRSHPSFDGSRGSRFTEEV